MATKDWREPNRAGEKKRPKPSRHRAKKSRRQTPILQTTIRSIAFLATLVVLAVAGRLIWDQTRSIEKTTLFLLNQPAKITNEKISPTEIDTTARFSSESYTHLMSPNEHLVCENLDRWDEDIELGPEKKTVLYYLGGDLIIDQENRIWISKNLQNSSKNKKEGWINISERIKEICNHQPKSANDEPLNRVLFLDIDRVDSKTGSGSNKKKLSTDLSELLIRLNEDVSLSPQLNRFWLITSVGDNQKSWFSPELNSSVFSYFLGMGLNGHAAAPDNEVITLKGLLGYIKNSVNRWTLDHRFSAQSPQLISLSKIEHDKVPIIYSKKTSTQLRGVFQIPGNNNRKLKDLWSKFKQQKTKNAFEFRPHYQRRVEALLIEMESTRYATENESRGKRLFDRLHSEASKLLDAIPLPSDSNVKLSVEQFLNRNPNYASNLPEFKNFLFPTTRPSEDESPELSSSEEPVFFKQMQRIDRVDFIWRYLSTDEISNDPMTRETLAECLHLIDSAAPAENSTTSTDLLEVGFLRLLNDNINWFDSDDRSGKNQLQTVLHAIQCRRISERLIQGRFTVDRTERIVKPVRYWLPIRVKHQELDQQRRRAEDLLLANNTEASTQFINLLQEFSALEQRAVSIIQANAVARETLQISSYLKSFWEQEARLVSSSERSKIAVNALLQLSQARQIASEIIAPNLPPKDLSTKLDSLITINEKLGNTLEGQYYDNLSNAGNSASDVVFHAIQLLESPIPEWSAVEMSRDKLRNNLDRWLGEQSNKLKGDYSDPLKPIESGSKLNDEIANAEAWPVPPQHSLLKKLGTPSAHDYSLIIAALQEGGRHFEDHFNKANNDISNITDLVTISNELSALNVEMICGHEILSKLAFNLDVGSYPDLIAQFIQIRDQFERNKYDCWGDGDVTNLDKPPLMTYGNILATKYKTQLEKLKDYGTNEADLQCHLELEPLQKVVESDIAKLNENWQELSRTALEWDGKARELEFENDLLVTAKINSEFAPRDVGEENSSLVMKSETRLAAATGNPNPLEFNFDQKQKLTPSVDFTEQELSKKVEIESVVAFRGHLFKKRSIFLKKQPQKDTTVKYQFGQKITSRGSPTIKVIDATPMQADIIFVLDCSESMIAKDSTRFQNAQAALIESLENLSDTKRFRFSLYGFGHRNGFITNDKNQYIETQSDPPKFRVSNNNADIPHPLEDCQQIFALEGNEEAITSKDEVEMLKLKILALQPQGVTPLFYSIKDALTKEFSAKRPKNRRRLIVVLSDGKNTDPSGEENSLLYTPPGQTASDLTKPNDVKKLIDSSGAELIIARIYGKNRDPITKDEEKGLIDSGTLPDNILKIDDSNSTEISKRILQAIGTSRFTVTPEGEEAGHTTYALGKKIKRPAGNYTVSTVGVTKDDNFLVELYDDVAVILKNTNEGLMLDEGIPPRFLQNVTCQLGSARYQIGLISKKPNSLAFGFKKNKDVTGGNSPNFSFRPQRIWLQLTEVNSKRVHNLFLPSYSTGIHPIAEFELPDKLDGEMVDICLWITPNVNDGFPPLQTTGKELELGSTTVEQRQVSLKKIQENLYEATVAPGSDENLAVFVDCSSFDTWRRTQNFQVDNLINETFRYRVTADDARFNFHALPRDQYQKILNDITNAPGNSGKGRDPIFGSKGATWIKLKGVRLTR
ncbi:MAG: VWA domain-containing protein [Planctomycetaceae bacterium]|nr:VWA domain-containing protein [Planctomycetaceae bacterium]